MNGDRIRVLVVDDQQAHAEAVAEALTRVGYECQVAPGGAEGAAKLENDSFDVVITDLRMGEIDGLAILRKAKMELPDAEVILVTGHGDIKTAVAAMQGGAATYLTKPVDINELRGVVDKATARHRLARTNKELQRQLDEKFGFEGVIGTSPAMHAVLAKLKQFAPTDGRVLILGETGTGKELVAKALHYNSPRRAKPFVALNCTALNENLLEDELFGHEPGAFTGGDRLRKGKIEHANGGTLFLDELGDMPPTMQQKLLRVLEDGQVFRIGGNEPIRVNVRVISATHRDLEAAVAKGQFRQDLYFRLKVMSVKLPPLRERREDIILLATHFLKEFASRYHRNVTAIAPEVRRLLTAYDWPGNVRELRGVLESMVAVDRDGTLGLDDLPENPGFAHLQTVEPAPVGHASLIGKPLEEVERFYILKALELSDGNRKEAAQILRISERTLYRKLDEYEEQGHYTRKKDGKEANA